MSSTNGIGTSREFPRGDRDARVKRVKRVKAVDETIDTLLDGDSVPENGPRNDAQNILMNGLSDDFVSEPVAEETRYDEDLSAKGEPGDVSATVSVSDDGRSSKSRALFSDMDLLLPAEAQQDRPAPRFEGYDGDEGMQTHASPRREKKPGPHSEDQRMGVSTNRRRGISEGDRVRGRASDSVAAAKNRLEDRFQGEDRSVERARQRQRSGDALFAADAAAAISAAVAAESDGVELDALDAIVGAFLSDDQKSPPSPEAGASAGDQKGKDDVASTVVPPRSEGLTPDDAPVENNGLELGSGSSTVSEIGGMKVTELKEKCKAMGLPVSGRKAELQERILKALN